MASICLVLLTIVLVGHILADGQVCNNGAVQLVRYGSFNEEYVQYCHNGKWHSLCAGSGSWTRVEANVVCRQMGLSGQGAKKGGSDTPRASQPYFMFGDISCAGGESSIGECRIHTSSTCSYNREGWVKCQLADCTNGTVRLVGGTTNREGRVDFCIQGHWASICYNEDLELAGTFCKMLGFPIEVTNDGTKLSCKDSVQMPTRGLASLVIKCQTHNYAVQNTTSALGAAIGLLVLLEVGTVIAWVACTVTRKRLSSSPKQRVLTQVNESYTDTALIEEPSYSSLGPNYNTGTTSDKGIGGYDVIDHNKQKPKPSNPPPVKVEASKSEDEFYNAEEHMYAAVNKEKKNNVGGE